MLLAIMLFASCKVNVSVEISSTQDNMQQTSIPFPSEQGFTREFLQENFWKCTYNLAGDSLTYWVVLPNNMKPVRVEPVRIGETNLINIGQYERVDDSPYLEAWVLTEYVTSNIEPADWLRGWLNASDETILQEKEVIGSAGSKFLDVLTSKLLDDGNSSISRCTVFRSGKNYFFIKVSCSENSYESLAKTIQHISSSWGIAS